MSDYDVQLRFEGQGPELTFVEAENSEGESVNIGEWVQIPDSNTHLLRLDYEELLNLRLNDTSLEPDLEPGNWVYFQDGALTKHGKVEKLGPLKRTEGGRVCHYGPEFVLLSTNDGRVYVKPEENLERNSARVGEK